ncbi:MAG: hypothetical protein D6732_05015 [Methanobacteriota archaeon]|nr:MAG: hypothetical protein D6732_05015 [Euryarchaeota archaeon]
MEGKIVLNFVFSVLGFFTILTATNTDLIANLFLMGGFLLLAIDRLILLSLLQLKRLSLTQVNLQRWTLAVFLVAITLGLLFGKILAGDTFIPLPFGYFIQLSLSYVVCLITGAYQFRNHSQLVST